MPAYQIRRLLQLASALVWLTCLALLMGVGIRTLRCAVPDTSRQAAEAPASRTVSPATNQRSERVVATNHQWASQHGSSGQ